MARRPIEARIDTRLQDHGTRYKHIVGYLQLHRTLPAVALHVVGSRSLAASRMYCSLDNLLAYYGGTSAAVWLLAPPNYNYGKVGTTLAGVLKQGRLIVVV